MATSDELTTTISDALSSLPLLNKASFLLDTALALIEAGRYGPQVEHYLDVYLRAPQLPKEDVARALLARGNARKVQGERLLAQAEADFQAVLKADPSNREIQKHLRRERVIHFKSEPASQRAPAEIWERIALHIPRYHLRTWLSVSSFHRDIASRIVFRTLDLYFGEDVDATTRGLDIFDRAKADPVFASRVRSLRLHWAYEEGDMMDLMARIFRSALTEFKALRDFEWIGYPEMRDDMVKAVLAAHPALHALGLIGWHFDAEGVSRFRHLRKFTLRAEDDDGFADMGEVRTVLDENADTLRHLILGAYLARHHSWDNAFQSVTVSRLTHLDLVDTRISHFVLTRITHAQALVSLTLHGTFEEPAAAAIVFGSDHAIGGQHTILPHLQAFRFALVGHEEETALYQAVVKFLHGRTALRRLDLGNCPSEMVLSLLPDLINLRVLGIRIANLTKQAVHALVTSLPQLMTAITLYCAVSDAPMSDYAPEFVRFINLAFLHFRCGSKQRPQENIMSEKEHQVRTEVWNARARAVALAVKSLDFIGWHGEHYVIVRGQETELRELPSRRRLDCGKGVDLGTEDAIWLERKDVPIDYEQPGIV
ncbi:hypothetical protein HDZ31DRAFT_45224 [Schizophyllum fasciatum]